MSWAFKKKYIYSRSLLHFVPDHFLLKIFYENHCSISDIIELYSLENSMIYWFPVCGRGRRHTQGWPPVHIRLASCSHKVGLLVHPRLASCSYKIGLLVHPGLASCSHNKVGLLVHPSYYLNHAPLLFTQGWPPIVARFTGKWSMNKLFNLPIYHLHTHMDGISTLFFFCYLLSPHPTILFIEEGNIFAVNEANLGRTQRK